MEQFLWTIDDVVRFIHHPDLPVRRWVLNRLTKRFPAQAGEALVVMLDDPDPYIAHQAARFLSKTGDRSRYGPILLDRLRRAQDARFGPLAEALARLGHREALPLVLERLGQDQASIDTNEFLYLVNTLGLFGGDGARHALWQILDSFDAGTFVAGAVLESLLNTAQPRDIARAVQAYHSWPVSPYHSRELRAFATAVGTGRLAEALASAVEAGLDGAMERAAAWLGREPELSESCLAGLAAAFERGHHGVFEVLLCEARRLVEERGHDLAGWRAAWDAGERPTGYRGQVVYTLLVFEAFAAHPSSHSGERMRESGLGLALLSEFSIGSDDQATLDIADDKAATLVSILAQDRDNVLPDIVEQVAALGPEIVPRLVAMLDPDDYSWGMIRAIRAIERLARLHPGSCDAAIPGLIAVMHQGQGDFALEGSSDALEAIGAAAAGPIIEHLRDDDMARQIYLTGVLEEIPTESAAQAILDWLADGEPLDEMHVTTLAGIGSPSAIEPLYTLWKSDPDRLLAEYLLVLCELNSIHKPELPEWRRVVETEESRMSRLFGSAEPLLQQAVPVADQSPPLRTEPDRRPEAKQRSVRKPKTISKREKKKRSAQRKGRKKKRKK